MVLAPVIRLRRQLSKKGLLNPGGKLLRKRKPQASRGVIPPSLKIAFEGEIDAAADTYWL